MRRAARCDGVVPEWDRGRLGRRKSPKDLRDLRAWLSEHGARADIDVVAEGETPADDPQAAADRVAPWAEAGATWWLETRWSSSDDVDAGPPNV
jgi:hypothetical protein